MGLKTRKRGPIYFLYLTWSFYGFSPEISSSSFNISICDEVCNQTPLNEDPRRPEIEDPLFSLSIMIEDVIKRELSAYKNHVHLLDSSQCFQVSTSYFKIEGLSVDPLTSKRAIVSFFISRLLFCSSKFCKKTSPKHPRPISFFTWSLLHSKSRMSRNATRDFCLEALATGMVQTCADCFAKTK